MPIVRYNMGERENFVVTSYNAIRDKLLDWDGRGMHTYFMSRPANWTVYLEELMHECPRSGREKTRRILRDLQETGYIFKSKHREPETGFFRGWDTTVFETVELAQLRLADAETGKLLKDLPEVVEETQYAEDAALNHVAQEHLSSAGEALLAVVASVAPEEPPPSAAAADAVAPPSPPPPVLVETDAIDAFERQFRQPAQGESLEQQGDEVLGHLFSLTGREYTSKRYIKERLRDGRTVQECRLVLDWLHTVRRAKNPEWCTNNLNNLTPFKDDLFDKYLAEARVWDRQGRTPPELPQGGARRTRVMNPTLAALEQVQQASAEEVADFFAQINRKLHYREE